MTISMAPAAVRITTVVAVVVVAVVAAVVSYSHMTELARSAGEQWRSWLIPISVDGLIVAASMVLLTRHRAGQPGGYLAWGSLGVGVVASLAANMADARPEVTSVLVAGWAPVAFAAAFHLLLQQRRAEHAIAPLRDSGSPAGRALTVVPPADGGPDRSVSPPWAGSSSPARSASPGPGWPPAGAVVSGPQAAPVRSEVPAGRAGDGLFVATDGATNGATASATNGVSRRDKQATGQATDVATKPATRVRQKKVVTAEQRRAWVRQQRDNGRDVTGADVHKQFPDAPRDGARIVRQVLNGYAREAK